MPDDSVEGRPQYIIYEPEDSASQSHDERQSSAHDEDQSKHSKSPDTQQDDYHAEVNYDSMNQPQFQHHVSMTGDEIEQIVTPETP